MNEILDDDAIRSRRSNYWRESYWCFLISILLWFITSSTIGLTGYLPWSWSINRTIAIVVGLIILTAALGFRKALFSRSANESKSRKQKVGYFGNIFIIIIFIIFNVSNLLDVMAYFKVIN